MRRTRCGRFNQRLTMTFALEHRQAVIVRTHTALEDRVAVIEQMMRRDGCAHIATGAAHKGCRICRGDVLKDHAQIRKLIQQWLEHLFDERRFSIK